MRKICLCLFAAGLLAAEPFEIDVDDGMTAKFCGKIEASSFTKKGNGTYVMVGTNIIESAVYVDAGTLRLGTPADLDGLLFDFDSSVDASLTRDESGLVTQWASAAGALSAKLNTSAPAGLQSGILGNRPALLLYDDANVPIQLRTSSKTDCSQMKAFAAVFSEKQISSGARLWQNDVSSLNSRRGILHDGTSSGKWRYYHADRDYGSYTKYIYVNGIVQGANIPSEPTTLVLQQAVGAVSAYYLVGSSTANNDAFYAAVGEMLAFNATLSTDQRRAIESHLAWKWKTVRYSPTVSACGIPFGVAVSVAENAVLDLGGHEIAPSSLENAGLVKDGTITLKGGMSLGCCENITLRVEEILTSPATINTSSGTLALEINEDLSGDFELLACDTSSIPPPSFVSSTYDITPTESGYSLKSKQKSHGTIISLN